MKVQVETKKLLEAIKKVVKIIPNNNPVPAVNMLKVTARNDAIILEGTNTHHSVIIPVKVDNDSIIVERTGGILTPKSIREVLEKMGKKVLISTDENCRVRIKSLDEQIKSDLELVGMSIDEYPRIHDIDQKPNFKLKGKDLINIVERTKYAAGVNEVNRPILQGHNFHLNNGILTVVSTDSHRLARICIPVDSKEELIVNIHSTSLDEVARIVNEEEKVEVIIGDSQIAFKTNNMTFISRLLEGNYPSVDRIIPKEHSTLVKLNRAEMIASLERMALLGNRDSICKISIKDLEVKMLSEQAQVGKIQEHLFASDFQGEEVNIVIRTHYLLDALKNGLESKDVVFKLKGSMTPVKVLQDDLNNNLHLIVPMRQN